MNHLKTANSVPHDNMAYTDFTGMFTTLKCSRYSDSLWAGQSGDQIPVGDFLHVWTGPGVDPATYTMGTRSFPGVKRPGPHTDHPPPSRTKVKERVELYIYSLSGPSWPVLRSALPLPLLWNVVKFCGASINVISFIPHKSTTFPAPIAV